MAWKAGADGLVPNSSKAATSHTQPRLTMSRTRTAMRSYRMVRGSVNPIIRRSTRPFRALPGEPERERTAARTVHFEGPQNALGIARTEPFRALGIDLPELCAEPRRAPSGQLLPGALRRTSGSCCGKLLQALEQGPQVEAAAAHHDRHPAAAFDLGERRARPPGELAGREALLRIQDVDQVVRHPAPLLGLGLAVPMSSPR